MHGPYLKTTQKIKTALEVISAVETKVARNPTFQKISLASHA
jgi:hypothetical protein